jgi:hypothetical protein
VVCGWVQLVHWSAEVCITNWQRGPMGAVLHVNPHASCVCCLLATSQPALRRLPIILPLAGRCVHQVRCRLHCIPCLAAGHSTCFCCAGVVWPQEAYAIVGCSEQCRVEARRPGWWVFHSCTNGTLACTLCVPRALHPRVPDNDTVCPLVHVL